MKLFVSFLIAVSIFGGSQGGTLDDSLISSFSGGEKKDVVFQFSSVLSDVLSNKALKGLSGGKRQTAMINLMQKATQAMQAPIINSLSTFGIGADRVESFWMDNKFVVKDVDLGPLKAFSAIPGPFQIREVGQATAFPAIHDVDTVREVRQTKLQWGVEKINASVCWNAGYKGKGIVVGIIDTGINAKHEALLDAYKNDTTSWKDGFNEHDTPYDGHGHGTHCAGTVAGRTNGIGVAIEAKIIACRGLNDEGSGDETSLSRCGEWMACPGKDENGNCIGMPHLVSNSWGGRGGQTWFNGILKSWKSMGIIPVFAIGNSYSCGTAGSPGDQPDVIGVASTTTTDKLSSFSSRGPYFAWREYPDLAAPGSDIVSASNKDNTGYVTMSGTSMATPHVAGAIAVYKSKYPSATYDDVYKAFSSTAVQPKLTFSNLLSDTCLGPLKYPNVGYGYGRIDLGKVCSL